ncbi:SpoIIE family protein phosphatase [Streptomyces sp. NPDC049040]|uniref:SpoIIE family protein phosphatase n=1 Tax=Streptomyces sp. NPDC049040 TaxID=3365593 RepID=UPI00371ADA0F
MHGNDRGPVRAEAREAATRVDHAFDSTARAVGAHVGNLFLHVPERQALQMTSVIGGPSRLAKPWSPIALAAPVPAAEAARSQAPVLVADQQQMARRFPQAALVFPYSVGIYAVPLMAGGACWGVMQLLWPGSHAALSATELAATREAAEQMAWTLKEAADQGHPVRPRDEPLVVQQPPPVPREGPAAALTERFSEGFVALDFLCRMTFVSARAARLLGRDRAELLGADIRDVLPWLADPAHDNAYLSAFLSRVPTGFAARRPDGARLSVLLHPDATGISVRIVPADSADSAAGAPQHPKDAAAAAPTTTGTLFHLLHLTAALTEASGAKEVTESLIEQMMPILDAQGLALVVADEGRLRVMDSRGFPPRTREYFDGIPLATRTEGTRTMETGIPRFHPDTAQLVRDFPQHRLHRDMAAFAFLPLTVSSGTFGCWVLGYDEPHPFSADERAELTSLAGMIAQALERARLYDVNAHVARGLQDGLLPRRLPEVRGLEVAARYRPATHAVEVGGDFYDLVDFGDRSLGAVIGDVQGHSVQAAALMGQIRTAVHTHARVGAPPEEIFARTNRLLIELSGSMFCSCLYAHLDLPGRRAVLASAGHPPPILRHPDHSTEVVDLPPGLLLGVEEDAPFQPVELPMPPGSLLALYTDGLVERHGVDLGLCIDSLAEQLAQAGDEPLDDIADALVARAEETVVPQSSDDIALLLLRCPG